MLPEQEEFSSAGKVVPALQQGLLDSLVAMQDHNAAGAQVQSEHRPKALCQLETSKDRVRSQELGEQEGHASN